MLQRITFEILDAFPAGMLPLGGIFIERDQLFNDGEQASVSFVNDFHANIKTIIPLNHIHKFSSCRMSITLF